MPKYVSYNVYMRDGSCGILYLPYKGHAAEGDFKAFIADERILMNQDIR